MDALKKLIEWALSSLIVQIIGMIATPLVPLMIPSVRLWLFSSHTVTGLDQVEIASITLFVTLLPFALIHRLKGPYDLYTHDNFHDLEWRWIYDGKKPIEVTPHCLAIRNGSRCGRQLNMNVTNAQDVNPPCRSRIYTFHCYGCRATSKTQLQFGEGAGELVQNHIVPDILENIEKKRWRERVEHLEFYLRNGLPIP